MKSYKGYKYFLGIDKLWKVVDYNYAIVVATINSRNKLDWALNNEKTCKSHIDWLIG